ncbi:MAG: hypothetical protein V3V62_08005, partial [bacterium]
IMVEKPILYGTPNFAVMPEKGRVQLGMTQLNRNASVNFQDREYERFTGQVRAGGTVRLHFKAPDSTGNISLFYGAGGGIFVLGAGIAVWVRRRRRSGLALRVERETLLGAIAELDDRLDHGEISPEAHARDRAPRFARLRDLSR